MAKLRRFSESDVATLKAMHARGHDGRTIALALGRPAEAIRSKAVALGLPLRPASMSGRRIKLTSGTWAALQDEAAHLRTTPSRLARLVIEAVMQEDLVAAVLDLPRALRRPMAQKRERRWQVALASRNFDVSQTASR
jgi:hypothetical protein